MRLFALALLALCLNLLAASLVAAAPVCFADSQGVKRHSPNAWPIWTKRMEGHKGEKCWIPSTKASRSWKANTISPSSKNAGAQTSISSTNDRQNNGTDLSNRSPKRSSSFANGIPLSISRAKASHAMNR